MAMISAAYCQMMARYNRWQNEAVAAAMGALPEADISAERGAFFGSLFGTANHLLWGDAMWMARFAGWEAPSVPGGESATYIAELSDWAARRREVDAGIIAWAEGLEEAWLAGELTWFSGVAGRNVSKPVAACVVHFFNHQTHHRGQIHKMLTEQGYETRDTDLFLLPE